MTRKPINYNKSIIYKIVCNNPEVKDIYIGTTTELVKRRSMHKSECKTPTNKNYNKYLYKYIRDNSGFNNWSVIQIEQYNCNTLQEVKAREHYWIEQLNARLNRYE